jgi:hypothetical protein
MQQREGAHNDPNLLHTTAQQFGAFFLVLGVTSIVRGGRPIDR